MLQIVLAAMLQVGLSTCVRFATLGEEQTPLYLQPRCMRTTAQHVHVRLVFVSANNRTTDHANVSSSRIAVFNVSFKGHALFIFVNCLSSCGLGLPRAFLACRWWLVVLSLPWTVVGCWLSMAVVPLNALTFCIFVVTRTVAHSAAYHQMRQKTTCRLYNAKNTRNLVRKKKTLPMRNVPARDCAFHIMSSSVTNEPDVHVPTQISTDAPPDDREVGFDFSVRV
jgi:hypothetical protein